MNVSITMVGAMVLTMAGVWAYAEEAPVAACSRVYCDQHVGKIKPMLNGVSQGGDTATYWKDDWVQALRPLNLKLVRLEAITGNAFYKIYDPQTGKYYWDALDKEIENIQSTGAEVLANIFYMPKWLSSDPEGKLGDFRMTAPKDYDAWRKYVYEIVHHVNIDKKYGIKYWEIWNEPSGVWAFQPWVHGREPFFKLYAETAKAIKQADPTALVGGFGDNADYPEHYAAFFRFAKANNVPIDFLTIHWYAEWRKDGWKQPELFLLFSQMMKRLYVSYFGKSVPMFYSEWNSDAAFKVPLSDALRSAYVGQGLFWMQNSPIDGAAFFRTEPFGHGCNVLNGSKEIQSVGRVLGMFSELPEQRVGVCDDSTMTVRTLAAKSDKRLVAMTSRYDYAADAKDGVWLCSFVNHGLSGKATVTTHVENRSNASVSGPRKPASMITIDVAADRPIDVRVTLEPYTVSLIVIEPEKK